MIVTFEISTISSLINSKIFLATLFKFVNKKISNEIKKLYPSEKKIVFEKFKEANSDFFLTYPKVQELIKKLGIIDFLVEIAKELKLLNILKAIITETWSGSLNKPSAD